jgi:DNA-binding FadR family transcriptional regulator
MSERSEAEKRGPQGPGSPSTGDGRFDHHARFIAEVIHREAAQTRLILETILAQLIARDISNEDKKCLDDTLAQAKHLAKRLRLLAASLAALDNETAS